MKQILVRRIGVWAGFAVFWLAVVDLSGQMTASAQALGAILIVMLFGHAVVALGWLEACAFAAICLIISFSIENLGALTGFPFGQYSFLVGAALPHIGVIPLIVGPLYLGMGYCSWIIASFILNRSVRRPSAVHETLALPVTAAFVMVQWDVVMDPSGSTLNHAWVWYRGGAYFGVPLTNFLGWFLLTYLYFQLFTVFLSARRIQPTYAVRSRSFWATPVLLYMAAGLSFVPRMFDANVQLSDLSGQRWSASRKYSSHHAEEGIH
jgi:uncharacterized membrane protein